MNGRDFDFERMFGKLLNEQRDEGQHFREEKRFFKQVISELEDLRSYASKEVEQTEDEQKQEQYQRILDQTGELADSLRDHLQTYKQQ